MNSGIYQILNIQNGKRYIGSGVDIKERWRSHISLLKRGIHHNKHLQNSFNKYGENVFKFTIIEIVQTPEELILLEQHHIDKLKPEYNKQLIAGSSLGIKHNEEARKNMSNAQKIKGIPEAQRKKMTEGLRKVIIGHKFNLGKKHSEETRKKMSESGKKRWANLEYRKKQSEVLKGVTRSEKFKQKVKEYWKQWRQKNKGVKVENRGA